MVHVILKFNQSIWGDAQAPQPLHHTSSTLLEIGKAQFNDYRQELVHILSSARLEAAKNLSDAQLRYKSQHDMAWALSCN